MPGTIRTAACLLAAAAMTAACGGGGPRDTADSGPPASELPSGIPNSLAPFGDGFPNPGDPCHEVGPTSVTSPYIENGAQLVGCPSEADAEDLGGTIVGDVEGIHLVSVPYGAGPGGS